MLPPWGKEPVLRPNKISSQHYINNTSSKKFHHGHNGIYFLGGRDVAKLTINAESKQGIYSYRDGRWLNLETGEYTTREALEREEKLKLVLYSQFSQATGPRIRVSNQARKISVLDSSLEPFPNLEKSPFLDLLTRNISALEKSTLEENDVYVFTNRGWKNPKTGQYASRVIFESRPSVAIYLSRTDYGTAQVQQFGQADFGVTGIGKYVRLSDGGMTIETSDVPFEINRMDSATQMSISYQIVALEAEIAAQKILIELNQQVLDDEDDGSALPDSEVEAVLIRHPLFVQLLTEKVSLLDQLEKESRKYASDDADALQKIRKKIEDVDKRIEKVRNDFLPELKKQFKATLRQMAQQEKRATEIRVMQLNKQLETFKTALKNQTKGE